MSYTLGRNDLIASVGTATLTGAVNLEWAPGRPVNVRKIVLVTTTASTVAGVLTVIVRNVDNTSSTTYGTATLPAVRAVNSVHFIDVVEPATTGTVSAIDGSLVYGALPGNIQINPGQELAITSPGLANTGVATVFVEYDELPNQPARFNAIEVAFVRDAGLAAIGS